METVLYRADFTDRYLCPVVSVICSCRTKELEVLLTTEVALKKWFMK
jgi:hypothetical protein